VPELSAAPAPAGDDLIQAFSVEGRDVRGRLARLGPLVDTVLTRHDYPPPVSHLLGEALALAVLIGSSLKQAGTFTLQAKGDGAVRLLVVDVVSPGTVRGYAAFDAEKVAALDTGNGPADIHKLMGQGYFALTIDPAHGERYQGIVALEGPALADCAHRYFMDSEQIPTRVRLAVSREMIRLPDGGKRDGWRAGGMMIQHFPKAEATLDQRGAKGRAEHDQEENWNNVTALFGTLEDHELVDSTIRPEEMMLRLFHESGVRAFAPTPVHFGCRCSGLRVLRALKGYDRPTLEGLADEGRISARCEFCNAEYGFGVDEVLAATGTGGAG